MAQTDLITGPTIKRSMQPIDGASVLLGTAHLGEGPLWCGRAGRLLWLDISTRELHAHEPATGHGQTWTAPVPCSALALDRNGGLLAATRDGFARIDLEKRSFSLLRHPDPSRPELCLNDGRCDRRGRFWAGAYNSQSIGPTGALFRLDPDLSCHQMSAGYTMPNGIGWSPGDGTLYFTDSRAGAIYAFDFDIESGSIANQRIFARIPTDAGRADGLTVDCDGFVWSAHWEGGCVTCYRPDGSIDRQLRLPAPLLTSCTFGGPDLDVLFVTSARWDMDDHAIARHPLSGSVFAVRTGAVGLPETPFAG